MSPDLAYELCGRLAGVGVVISAMELLVSLREYQPEGVYDPHIVRGETVISLRPRWEQAMLAPATLTALTVTRLLAGVVLLLAPWSAALQAAAWSAVAATSLYVRWRRQLGDDGAEQMLLIMSIAFAASLALHSTPGALEMGLYFVGAQSCLSYVVAGVAKLMGPDWRRGNVIPRILATRTYGSHRVALFLKRRRALTRMLCWTTIAFETFFVLAPLLPLPVLIGLLVVTAGFHLGNAVLMGLNGFFWAFVATYPAVVFLNLGVHSLLPV